MSVGPCVRNGVDDHLGDKPTGRQTTTKTEFIWFGTRTTLPKIPAAYRSLPVGSSVVQSCEAVRDLGVWFDSELSMKIHISRVVSICYYHLRRIRQLQHCLSQSTVIMLATSLILQRYDYCNSIFAAARLFLNLDYRAHITPALQQLYWLPVHYRIQ